MQKWNSSENSEQEQWMFQPQDEKGNSSLGGGLMKPIHTTYSYKFHYCLIHLGIFLKDRTIWW